MKESKTYGNKDVSDDEFAENQEHQAEDLWMKKMDDVETEYRICVLWMEDAKCSARLCREEEYLEWKESGDGIFIFTPRVVMAR